MTVTASLNRHEDHVLNVIGSTDQPVIVLADQPGEAWADTCQRAYDLAKTAAGSTGTVSPVEPWGRGIFTTCAHHADGLTVTVVAFTEATR